MTCTVTLKITVPDSGQTPAGLKTQITQTIIRSIEGLAIHSADVAVAQKRGVKSTVPAKTRQSIRDMHNLGTSERTIAAALKLSRGIVSRVLKST